MIECEMCGEYFKSDEIEPCPNSDCDLDDLCQNCFDKHATKCMLEGMFD